MKELYSSKVVVQSQYNALVSELRLHNAEFQFDINNNIHLEDISGLLRVAIMRDGDVCLMFGDDLPQQTFYGFATQNFFKYSSIYVRTLENNTVKLDFYGVESLHLTIRQKENK